MRRKGTLRERLSQRNTKSTRSRNNSLDRRSLGGCWRGFSRAPMSKGTTRWRNSRLRKNVTTKKPVISIKHISQLQVPTKKEALFVRGQGNQLTIDVILTDLATEKTIPARALLDSGCTGCTIDRAFVNKHKLMTTELEHPIRVLNADGTDNKDGQITEMLEVRMRIGERHMENIQLAVTSLHGHDIFLGYDWLIQHNPEVDWENKHIKLSRCPEQCQSMKLNKNTFVNNNVSMDIKIKENEQKEKLPWHEWIPVEYHDFPEVFEKTVFDALPEHRPWDHVIELEEGADISTLHAKVYPLNKEEQEEMHKFIAENMKSGRIRRSQSPIASPFFFVKKKTGDLRPVQDYRRLNLITIKSRYPLPLIQELIDKLKKAKIFSKFDIRWGYNNIRIREGDEWKAAFITNEGHFEPLVMFFGLCNSPSTFQTFMDHIFQELIAEGHVVVYMDDILIFTDTLEQHRDIVRRILQILKDNHLCVKPEKCEIEQEEMEFLGVVVGKGQVRMDRGKVQAIKEWISPKNKKGLQSFLGFSNFYRRFIREFAKSSLSLTPLTGKITWNWGPDQERAFREIIDKICEECILHTIQDEGRLKIEVDGSGYAMGAVLLQLQDDEWRTLAFMSKTYNPAERNYHTEDRELLAIILAFRHWRQYLMGKETFEVWTDHENLTKFKQPQKISRRQARWVQEMSEFNFTIHHLKGRENIRADALSRKEGEENMENDNEEQVILPEHLFRRMVETYLGKEGSEEQITGLRKILFDIWDEGYETMTESETLEGDSEEEKEEIRIMDYGTQITDVILPIQDQFISDIRKRIKKAEY